MSADVLVSGGGRANGVVSAKKLDNKGGVAHSDGSALWVALAGLVGSGRGVIGPGRARNRYGLIAFSPGIGLCHLGGHSLLALGPSATVHRAWRLGGWVPPPPPLLKIALLPAYPLSQV